MKVKLHTYKTFLFILLIFCQLTVLCQTKNQKLVNAPKPFVLGVIDEIQSEALAEKRILNIYLPEGYKQNDTTRYPVIYLLDGSADEDFIHIVGLVQFNSFEWVNQLPKSIVVGIATVDRKRDFTFPTSIERDKKNYPTTGHSDKFISFIERELEPYVQSKYKTNTSKTIIGQSLGGLLATEVLIRKPTLFNQYIIISPSLWWNNGSLLNRSSKISESTFNQLTKVYIAVGKEGLTPTEQPRVMEVDANLLAEKIKGFKNQNVKLYFDFLPQEDHATIMHQAVSNAFKFLYPKPKKE
ncbi:MAG: alpha/beta hydrolase [Sphingobacteriaceae bacterium]|nr:alpha/beta hydrolase [Sphingobacteriaceae bacterium]